MSDGVVSAIRADFDGMAAEYAAAPWGPSWTLAALWAEYGRALPSLADAALGAVGRPSVTVTADPEPYADLAAMAADLAAGRFRVSGAHLTHPVWDGRTNVLFRVWHDLAGHARAAAPFRYAGEIRAALAAVDAHARLGSPAAWAAVEAAEILCQTARYQANGGTHDARQRVVWPSVALSSVCRALAADRGPGADLWRRAAALGVLS